MSRGSGLTARGAQPGAVQEQIREALRGLQDKPERAAEGSRNRGPSTEVGAHEHAAARAKGPLSRLNQAHASLSEAAKQRQKLLIGYIDPGHPLLSERTGAHGDAGARTPVREQAASSAAAALRAEHRASRVGGVTGTGTPSWANKPRRSVVSERYEAGKGGASRGSWAEDCYEAILLKRDVERLRLGGRAERENAKGYDFFEDRVRRAGEGGSAERFSASPDEGGRAAARDPPHWRYSVSPAAHDGMNVGFMADQTRADMARDRLSVSPDALSSVNVGFVADDTLAGLSPYDEGQRRVSLPWDVGTRSRSSSRTPEPDHPQGWDDGHAGWRHSMLTERVGGGVSGPGSRVGKDIERKGGGVNAGSQHHSVGAGQEEGLAATRRGPPRASSIYTAEVTYSKPRAVLTGQAPTQTTHEAHSEAVIAGASRVSFAATLSDTGTRPHDPARDPAVSQRPPDSRRTAFDSPRQSREDAVTLGAQHSKAPFDLRANAPSRAASQRTPSSRVLSTAVATNRIPESAFRGGGMHLGLEAMGNLALSARVHLHMGLTLPKGLAALKIQSVWRSFAVRKTAPILIAHAGRVCQIVDKHRRANNDEDLGSEKLPIRGAHSEWRDNAKSERRPDDDASMERSRGILWAFHSQDEHKQKVASSWSSRRVIYPLPLALRATCPFYSSGLEACLCVCFVSNLVAFYLESRSTEEASSGSLVAVTRLQAIVETQEREMLHNAQAHIRGWLTRRRALAVLMPPATWSVKNLILAQRRRRAGCVVLSRMRQHVCVSRCSIHAAVIRQLHIMAQAELAFVEELDAAIVHFLAPLNRAAGVDVPSHDDEVDDLLDMLTGVVTPRDASIICGAVFALRQRSGELLDALRSCLGNLPHLNLSTILLQCTKLFPALCQHICNFPSSLTTLAKCRRFPAFASWIDSREMRASAPLAASLLAPVERLDNIISALSALRDSASPWHEYHSELQACVRSSLETVGQLRYRKRDCHEMMRLSRISEQFVGEVGLDIVRPHRRLVRSSKLLTLKATDYYIDPRGIVGARTDGCDTNVGDEQVVIGGANLLFFLFNDCLVAASVSTRVHDDGTLTPEKRTGGIHFTSTPGSASGARQAAMMDSAKKSASKKTTRTRLDSSLTRPAMLYRMEAAVPLLGAQVTDEQDVPEKGVQHAIRVDDVTGQAIVMCAQSEKDKQEWLHDLRSMAAALAETMDGPYAFNQ